MLTAIAHFKERLLEVTAIMNADANVNGRLNQNKIDTWLKTKSSVELIDRG
jgi:hypothetical protein